MFSYFKERLCGVSSSETPTQTAEDSNYAGETVAPIVQSILAKAHSKCVQEREQD